MKNAYGKEDMLVELFTDAEVERILRAGHALTYANGRTVMLPKSFGFCNGVRRAIRAVDEALRRQPAEKIWIVGELIHNPTVNRRLRQAGIRVMEESRLDHFFCHARPDDLVIVPAFGIGLELERKLLHRFPPESIVDTTCGYVKRVGNFLAQATGQGCSTLVFGNPEHPEVRAIVSRAQTDDAAIVCLRNVEAARRFAELLRRDRLDAWPAQDIRHRQKLNPQRLALINQTTLLGQDIRQVAETLESAVRERGGQLRQAHTLCRATEQRQAAALALCRQPCDLLLVIGGCTSSNTNQLYRIAVDHAPTYFINDASALAIDTITHCLPPEGRTENTRNWLRPQYRRIGLLAGASCPALDIGRVAQKIKCFPGSIRLLRKSLLGQQENGGGGDPLLAADKPEFFTSGGLD